MLLVCKSIIPCYSTKYCSVLRSHGCLYIPESCHDTNFLLESFAFIKKVVYLTLPANTLYISLYIKTTNIPGIIPQMGSREAREYTYITPTSWRKRDYFRKTLSSSATNIIHKATKIFELFGFSSGRCDSTETVIPTVAAAAAASSLVTVVAVINFPTG